MKKMVALGLTLVMTLLMVVCGGGALATAAPPTDVTGEIPQEKLDTMLYVGCSVRSFANPYLKTIADGCEIFTKYLDSIGQKYTFEVMLNEGSNDEQINAISAFLAKANGNAILFVDPNEAAVCGTIADMVDDAGAYMCTTWNKPDDINVWDWNNWVAHHSPDDVAMGYDIAVKMFESFETPGKGKILAVQGLLGNTTNTNRFAGLEKALAEYPDVELVATESAKWMAPESLALMETWLAAYSDVDGVWCANDNMAMGAIQALEAKGLAGKVKVVGINAIPNAVEYVAAGTMTATVDCDGWGQGGYTLAICYQAWLGQLKVEDLPESQRLFGTRSILVTSENVEEYKAAYIDSEPVMDFTKPYEMFWYSEYPV